MQYTFTPCETTSAVVSHGEGVHQQRKARLGNEYQCTPVNWDDTYVVTVLVRVGSNI